MVGERGRSRALDAASGASRVEDEQRRTIITARHAATRPRHQEAMLDPVTSDARSRASGVAPRRAVVPAGPAIRHSARLALERMRLDDRGLTALGVIVAVIAWTAIVMLAEPYGRLWGTGQDARCYWVPSLADPYRHSSWTQPIAYVYSPAFLQLVSPMTALPWQAFIGVWAALLLAAVRLLTGPRLFAVGIAFAAMELSGGNISLLLGVAVVAGFRWPAAWAFVLLTKVTPGVGLLWFAFRREWRSLGTAAAATIGVAAGSAVLLPGAWADWVDVLIRNAGRDGTWAAVPIPLWARLPAAVAILAWGARTDRRWTVPVAAMVALPALWYGAFSMLLAIIPLRETPPAAPATEVSTDAEPVGPSRGAVVPAGATATAATSRRREPARA